MSMKMSKRRAAGLAAIGAGAIGATIAVKKRRNGNGSKLPWNRS
jgi:hypothetical protein